MITSFVKEVKDWFPTMGVWQLVAMLCQDYCLKVFEYVCLLLTLCIDLFFAFIQENGFGLSQPHRARSHQLSQMEALSSEKVLVSRAMDIWSCNQHNKWKRFSLWLHLGFDPYPSKLQWLKVWWSNCDPQLIGSYYLEAAQKRRCEILNFVLEIWSPLLRLSSYYTE